MARGKLRISSVPDYVSGDFVAKQTDLGNRYALTALKRKRATLAGEIADFEKRAAWKRTQLEKLDATIELFGESVEKIRAVKPYKRIALFKQGELSTAVRDALRRAGKPLLLGDVVIGAISELKLDETAVPALRHRVTASLAYLMRKGAVTKAGRGMRVVWSIKK
jgi:hypothetical protein